MRRFLLSLIVPIVFFVPPQKAYAQEPLFPQVSGWKLTPEETVYAPNNLFDVIDGAADLYLEYDFVDLHIGRYTMGELEIKVELYKHGSAVDAFGIFSQERYADYHFIDLGLQGYMEKGALNFLSGVFYVKISTIQDGQPAQEAMLTIAKSVERHLKQTKSWPPLLAAFPPKHKKAYSDQYIAKNFLGYGSLNGAYVVSYEDNSAFSAFLIRSGDAQQARKTIAAFLSALPKNARTKEANGKFEIQDPNNGRVVLILKRNYLYGVVSQDAGKSYDGFLGEFERQIFSLK